MKGGRFLKFDDATRFWCVLCKDDVHKKVAHALRSAKSKRQNKKPIKKKMCHRQMNSKQIDESFILLLEKQQNLIQGVFRQENPPAPVDFIMDLSIIDELGSNLAELVL
jgi:tRNA threonylcarbamoyladenosine modification (KEOPS) complex Cgi121 subunit